MIVYIDDIGKVVNSIRVLAGENIVIEANESLENTNVTISNKVATYNLKEDKLVQLLPEGHIEITHA